jgi:hypothetical protein
MLAALRQHEQSASLPLISFFFATGLLAWISRSTSLAKPVK